MFAELEPYLSGDAVVILGGCDVGDDVDYCNSLAGAAGATVIASDDDVAYGPKNWNDPDFYSYGEWQVFDGSGSGSSSVSPDDYDLYSEPRPDDGGSKSGTVSGSGSGGVAGLRVIAAVPATESEPELAGLDLWTASGAPEIGEDIGVLLEDPVFDAEDSEDLVFGIPDDREDSAFRLDSKTASVVALSRAPRADDLLLTLADEIVEV